jgi:plastocyanin
MKVLKKILISIIILINFIFSQYNLSIGEYSFENQTIEIIMQNEEPIAGFQFTLTGLNIVDAYGGSAEDNDFSLNTSELGIVLGFSFSGDIIPSGTGTLTTLIFDSINSQYTEITNITLTSPNGVTLSDVTTSGTIEHGDPFCDGSWYSNAQLDECNICNGPGAIYECGCNELESEYCDCNENVLDECGVCGGNNSSCYFHLELGNFNIDEQTIDIMISNPEPILGFQFNLSGLNLISAYGGLAENNNFTTNVGEQVIIGFSFSGDSIPVSENELLTTISFNNVIGPLTNIENIILSDINAETINNINTFGTINHGEPNCAGDYYSFDDTNSYGCCFDYMPDCLGVCNGIAIFDDCGVCNGDGYSCLECFEFNESNCTTSPFCYWETENINCNNFSSSSQCNAIEGCNWVSGGGGGGGGYGNNDDDDQNQNENTRGFCDGGVIEIEAFCLDLPCSDLEESNCSITDECQWINSNTNINCFNLSEDYCLSTSECTWIEANESSYHGYTGHCSGDTATIEESSCSDLIIPGCMIDIATNFNSNANTDDGSCIFPSLGILKFEELDLWTGTLEVHLDCEYPVSEFTIDISGLNMTGCFGGSSEDAGFDIQMEENIITGISTGEYIPEHSGLLMILTFDNILNENICYEDSWITTSANIEYEAILEECLYVNLGCTDIYSLSYEQEAEYDNGTCSYANHTIEANMLSFNPDEINIEIGQSIQWNNIQGFHSINGSINSITEQPFNNPEDFYFEATSEGLIGSHIFNIPGIYEYDCDIGNHAEQGMTGSVIVGQGGCMDHNACNYDEEFDFQYGECDFAELNFNCNGECLIEVDSCGICGGNGSNGDVNENNLIEIADITYIIEYIIGEIIFNENQICTGDVNMNGILNVLIFED